MDQVWRFSQPGNQDGLLVEIHPPYLTHTEVEISRALEIAVVDHRRTAGGFHRQQVFLDRFPLGPNQRRAKDQDRRNFDRTVNNRPVTT